MLKQVHTSVFFFAPLKANCIAFLYFLLSRCLQSWKWNHFMNDGYCVCRSFSTSTFVLQLDTFFYNFIYICHSLTVGIFFFLSIRVCALRYDDVSYFFGEGLIQEDLSAIHGCHLHVTSSVFIAPLNGWVREKPLVSRGKRCIALYNLRPAFNISSGNGEKIFFLFFFFAILQSFTELRRSTAYTIRLVRM